MRGKNINLSKGKCFIIAEAGVNHNGDINCALEMIDTAAEAGADAVKFQTFRAEQIVARNAEKAEYQRKNTGSENSQFDMLKKLELPEEVYPEIIRHCVKRKIKFMSTAFDMASADFLDNLGMNIFKISSGELTNLPLISHIATKQKQMIVSTGMSTLDEISEALSVIRKTGNKMITLLQCTSNYPVEPENVNLRVMKTLSDKFNLSVGLSDHTLGIEISIAAVALGACVIEKHFTLDKKLPGPDHKMSLGPDELMNLVTSIRNVEVAFGSAEKQVLKCEQNIAEAAKKSIHYNKDLKKGSVISERDLVMLRPGTGVSPAKFANFVGRILKKNVIAGNLLLADDF